MMLSLYEQLFCTFCEFASRFPLDTAITMMLLFTIINLVAYIETHDSSPFIRQKSPQSPGSLH